MNRYAVIYIGQMYPNGIIRHFACLGVEIDKCAEGQPFDSYFASIDNDSQKGSWAVVKERIPDERIIHAPTFGELVQKIAGLFDRYQRVLVHSAGGRGMTLGIAPLKRQLGNRLIHVVTTHSYHINDWLRIPLSMFQAYLYRRYADYVIFQCPLAARRFVGHEWFFKHGKGGIIPLGVEPFPEKTDAVPVELKERTELVSLLLNRNVCKIIYLAAFRPGKGHDWLIRALAPYLRGRQDVVVLFCGGDGESYQAKLRELIRNEKLEAQIRMPGRIPRTAVPWTLQHCDAAVVPSTAETFGHNFIEPMFAGLPVIGTRVGAGEYALQDYRTGIGFSLKAPQTAAEAVRFIVEHREEAKHMGAYAKSVAEVEFSHASVASGLVRLYGELLSQGEAI